MQKTGALLIFSGAPVFFSAWLCLPVCKREIEFGGYFKYNIFSYTSVTACLRGAGSDLISMIH